MSNRALVDSVRDLLANFKEKHFCVAVSGGVDSVVMLHILAQIRKVFPISIKAIHVNHQLSVNASNWQSFVMRLCDDLQVLLITKTIDVIPDKKESIETAARRLRYQAMFAELDDKSVLLTGHHSNDQIETMLHHLFRGSGLKGLCAMQAISNCQGQKVFRPLLRVSKSEIEAYAKEFKLDWVDDESNQSSLFTRNVIRNNFLPELREKFPAIDNNIQRSNELLQSSDECLDYYVKQDLLSCLGKVNQVLDLEQLTQRPANVQSYLLRAWFELNQIQYPTAAIMEQILRQIVKSSHDTSLLIEWGKVVLRRYRSNLYLLPRVELPDLSNTIIEWDLAENLELPSGLGQLSVVGHSLTQKCMVKFSSDLTHVSLANTRITRKLKHIFQEAGIPVWVRGFMPRIYNEKGQLLVIPGLLESQIYAESAYLIGKISWKKGALLESFFIF